MIDANFRRMRDDRVLAEIRFRKHATVSEIARSLQLPPADVFKALCALERDGLTVCRPANVRHYSEGWRYVWLLV